MIKVVSDSMKEMIRECFALDDALLSLYHVYAGKGLDACVSKTLEDLKNVDESFTFYNVFDNSEHVGFYGQERIDGINYVNTIFIRPEFRNKHSVREFARLLPTSFCTGLYAKNLPAISFYLKQGGQIIKEFNHDGHDAVVIWVGE